MAYTFNQEVALWRAAFLGPKKFLMLYFGILVPGIGAALTYLAQTDLTPAQIGLSGLLIRFGFNLAWACAASIAALSLFCWGRIWEMVLADPCGWIIRHSGRLPWLERMPIYAARATLATLLTVALLQPIGLTISYSGIMLSHWADIEQALRCDAAHKMGGNYHLASHCRNLD
jgi:hypothetical protein